MRKSCTSVLPWERRALARLQKPRWSVALPGKTLENWQWICKTDINAALRKAHYEILPDGEGYYRTIEALQGVWANAATLEACREEWREVLEEWIVLGLRMGHVLPELD